VAAPRLPQRDLRRISRIVTAYGQHRELVDTFRKMLLIALSDSPELVALVHSFRSRLKEETHLRDKLIRKFIECREGAVEFSITPENLLTSVTDLAGIRVLHLHTTQIKRIDATLLNIFAEQRLTLIERFTRTWDDESRELFQGLGFTAQPSPSLYTSVHYIVGSNSLTEITAEIQVRTLMEEVWGEVDHDINYPAASSSFACREQLKVLARATSTATRLVDSIYRTLDHESRKADRPKRKAQSRVVRATIKTDRRRSPRRS